MPMLTPKRPPNFAKNRSHVLIRWACLRWCRRMAQAVPPAHREKETSMENTYLVGSCHQDRGEKSNLRS